METLLAVSLASNIAQFVDFTTKLLHATRELHTSANGATKDNEELALLVENVRNLAEKQNLRQLAENTRYLPDSGTLGIAMTAEDVEVHERLSSRCITLADDLMKVLNSLKIKGKQNSLEAAYVALRTIWKKSQLDALHQRLIYISTHLNSRMQQRYHDQIIKQLETMESENLRLEAHRTTEIQKLRDDFAGFFHEIVQGMKRKDESIEAWSQLPALTERSKGLHFEQHVLDQLHFKTMDRRREDILPEHANTFMWLLDKPAKDGSNTSSLDFRGWLQDSNHTFWITGKPGSGKSTLLKFISTHKETKRLLELWAEERKLIIAGHYFWSAAKDPLQKSQNGLLRSMLYQVLRESPDLIYVAFPSFKRMYESELRPNLGLDDTRELLKAVRMLLSGIDKTDLKFCFFIDGLDEYDGHPNDVIELVDALQRSEHVKMCVSSRPWNEFDARFGVNNDWKLYVHELTRDDIRQYVHDLLGANPTFLELREADDRCPDLVEDIVQAADGVFLWVVLVIRSLMNGLTNADRVSDLQARLREIPKDLEQYFGSILRTVEPRYREQMAQTFLVALESHDDLPLLCYWFMDEEDEHPEYMYQMTIQAAKQKTIDARINQMQRRLNARCKGLLEVRWRKTSSESDPRKHSAFKWEVDFLHRTVRDFLGLASMRQLLETWSTKAINIDMSICYALLAVLKSGVSRKLSYRFQNLLPVFFHHAKQLQGDQVRLVMELKEVFRQRNVEACALVPEGRIGEPQSKDWTMDVTMLATAIRYELNSFVIAELDREPVYIIKYGSTLLATALVSNEYNFLPGDENFDMFSLLLERGASLDQPSTFRDRAAQILVDVWEYYLGILRSHGHGHLPASSLHCLRALVTFKPGGGTLVGLTRLKGENKLTEDEYKMLRELNQAGKSISNRTSHPSSCAPSPQRSSHTFLRKLFHALGTRDNH